MAVPRTAAGYSSTSFEEAYCSAANEVLQGVVGNPDELMVVKIKDSGALFGGFVGYVNRFYVTVALERQADAPHTVNALAPTAQPSKADLLEITVSASPDIVWINDMSGAGEEPQEGAIAFFVTVRNPTKRDMEYQSPDSGFVRVDVLKGRTTIWKGRQDVVLPMLTRLKLRAGEWRQFGPCTWRIPDKRSLRGFDLNAVGIFEPIGQPSKGLPIPVKSAV